MSIPIKNGLFLGAALFIGTVVFISASPRGYLSYGTFPLMLVAILMMVKTGSDIKSAQGGFASFGDLFKAIFITVLVGYFIRMIGIYVSYNFINPEIAEIQKEISIEAIEKMSGLIGDDAMDTVYDELDNMNVSGIGSLLQQYLAYVIGTGAVVNAIISMVMRKDKPLIDQV